MKHTSLGTKVVLAAALALVAACSSASTEATASSSAAYSGNWQSGCGEAAIRQACPGCEEPPADVQAWWHAHGGTRLLGSLIDSGSYVTRGGSGEVLNSGLTYPTWIFERFVLQRAPDVGLQGMLLGSIKASVGPIGDVDDPSEARDPGFNSFSSSCTGLAHPVRGAFCDFYNRAGGFPVVGYPVTSLRRENGTLVQYFERMRLEWQPSQRVSSQGAGDDDCDYRLQLGALGRELLGTIANAQGAPGKRGTGATCNSDQDCQSGKCSEKAGNICAPEQCYGGARDTGRCGCARMDTLQDAVHDLCDIEQSCSAMMCCSEVAVAIGRINACLAARRQITQECFAGHADADHQTQIEDREKGLAKCTTIRDSSGPDRCTTGC